MESSIQIGKKEYLISRLKLREWLKLEDNRIRIKEATESKDIEGFSESVYSYISVAVDITREELDNLPWYNAINIFDAIQGMNNPKYEFPLLESKTKSQKVKWDYEERTWYIWSNNLASHYGWSLEYIAELEIDDAIGLLQEILVNDQLEKEWQWGLSELAYSYNTITKKSEFKELPRPDWMDGKELKELKPTKILKSMMPVGQVMTLEGKTEMWQ